MAAFGELSVSIANELNNPLTTILGYSNLLLNYDVKDGDTQEYLETIQTQADRAGQIISSLLDIIPDKPDSRVSTDINDILKKALVLNETGLFEMGIDLKLKLDEHLPPATVNQTKMERLFISIFNNSINAVTGLYGWNTDSEEVKPEEAGNRPTLKIKTSQENGNICISFTDNGPGILQENFDKIFEPFYSTQVKTSQVGLGLWMSRKIIGIHSGTIEVNSDPEKETEFLVKLPAD